MESLTRRPYRSAEGALGIPSAFQAVTRYLAPKKRPAPGLGSNHGASLSVAHLSQTIRQGAESESLRSMVYLTAPAEPRQPRAPKPVVVMTGTGGMS